MTETTTTTNTLVNYEATITALTGLKSCIETASIEVGKGTLKSVKANIDSYVSTLEHLPITTKSYLDNVMTEKTKKGFIAGLASLSERITNSIGIARQAKYQAENKAETEKESKESNTLDKTDTKETETKTTTKTNKGEAMSKVKETVKETKETKAAMPSKVAESKKIVLDTDKLSDIAEQIREEIETAMNAHFKAGKLLSEALEMFKAAGEPAKKWIEWAGLACGVKKAQAYNLVKVYNTFGMDSDFSNCSMRVLNSLVHLDSKLFDQIKDEASATAKAGKLTTRRVNQLIDTVKPKSKPAPKAEPKADKTADKAAEKETDKGVDKTTDAMAQESKTESKTETSTSNETSNETSNPAPKADTSELDKLRKENEALKAQLAEMNETLKRMEKDVKTAPKTVAPVLPQFSSDSPATVLGVKLGAGPAEINQVYRSMAKIFNASTCPEGAKALKAAREELLSSKRPANK